ncbi:MAG: gliding motility-associated C-terminal domain-containing protein [Bacteroidota bacterium]
MFAQSNEGKNFWFGFMEHRDIGTNQMVAMITSKTNTTGTIRMPFQNWSTSFSVQANEVALINLPQVAEVSGSERITGEGISIETNDPVSVYIHQYANFRSDASLVLPTEALGDEYYVLTYEGIQRQGTSYPSSFLVVAVEDDTEVSMRLSSNTLMNRSPGDEINITLRAGETYQVQGRNGTDDLTGTFLEGNKPFALFAGTRWSQVPINCGTRDNLMEQMYPTRTYGKQFAAIPNANMAFDVYRILASQDDTRVVVDDGNQRSEIILNAGEWTEFERSTAAFITADKPIQVAQFIVGQQCSGHFIGDPSMMLLNSVEQTRDTVTIFNSSLENITQNFINVLARTVDIPFIYLDGQLMISQGAQFNTFAANPEYSFARFQVLAGAHTIATEGCGVIVSAYGYGEAESYAYSGGASFRAINSVPILDGACLSDTMIFDSQLSPQRFEVNWDLGDGTRTSGIKVKHKYQQVGNYNIVAQIKDLCLDIENTATKTINITLRQALTAGPDQSLCEGADLELEAAFLEDAQYFWEGPNGFNIQGQRPLLNGVRPSQSGTYTIVGNVDDCETFPSSTDVLVYPAPQPNLGRDTFVCDDDPSFSQILGPGSFSTYQWQDNSTSSTFTALSAGVYAVTITDEFGCTAIDSLELTRECPTRVYVPTIFSPNGDDINDQFGVLGTDIDAIKLLIYDRWGNKVFEGNQEEETWDGTYKGVPAPAGVYLWKAQITGTRINGDPFTEVESGAVTLVR